MHNTQWVKMLNGWTNILNETDRELFSLSFLFFFQQIFQVSSRHKLHHDRQLTLLGDVYRDDLYNLWMLRFSGKIRKMIFLLIILRYHYWWHTYSHRIQNLVSRRRFIFHRTLVTFLSGNNWNRYLLGCFPYLNSIAVLNLFLREFVVVSFG